jgi:predicted nucleotide-binding protein (sugar kinase/HSP70/actin superfamily)
MCELIETGTPNIVCASPFACLPNHVVGKSVIKRLRQMHPKSNIVAVDYDPGASEVNQLNRIKLMMSTAYRNMELKEEEERQAAKEAAAAERKAAEDAKIAGEIRPASLSGSKDERGEDDLA